MRDQFIPIWPNALLLNMFFRWMAPVGAAVYSLHEIVDTRLSGWRPLRVMLAYDVGRVAEDISDILKGGSASQKPVARVCLNL